MKRWIWIESGVLLLLLAVIVLCGVRLLRDDSGSRPQNDTRKTQISLADCALSQEPIDALAGVRKTYSFTLPSALAEEDCLILHIMHQYCTVRIGGAVRYLYEDGAPRFIRTSGRYWACVSLSDADAGKPVEVQLTPVYRNVPEPEIFVRPTDQTIGDVLLADLPLAILGHLCVILGLSLFVIAWFTIFNRRSRRALLCLAILTVAAGVWKVSGLPITTLLLHPAQGQLLQPKAVYLYGIISFLVMPVLIIQFLNSKQQNTTAVPETLCAVVMALTAVVVLSLQLLGKLELQVAVPFLMAEIAILMLVMFALILHRRESVWLICFPICSCADLLITHLTKSARYDVFLMLCIVVSDYISGMSFVRRTIRQQSELRDARVAALIHQIQPHFIHNTLTSVYYLCDSDPPTAKRLVRDFNSHLRANFTSISAKTPIPFTEELEHVRAYLSVEQVRFSDKLFVEYDTPHTAFRMPALTLQPLVENAVKHNVDSARPPVHIRIRSMKTEDGSMVVIEDDGVGMDNALPETDGHVGLQNVADRLQMLCDGTLSVSPRPEGGTVVTVFIPEG